MEEKKVERVETKIMATPKNVRRIGFNLGYGVTQGVFAAMFMSHVALGFLKAVRKRMEKKVGLEIKVENDDDDIKETTDE